MKAHELVNVLNDLMAIHEGRLEIYKKALKRKTIEGENGRSILRHYVERDLRLLYELAAAIVQLGDYPMGAKSERGELYKVWFSESHQFLEERPDRERCVISDEAALKAYYRVLTSEYEWPKEIFILLASHRNWLLETLQSYGQEFKQIN